MPPTPTVLTPRGGLHYHFLAPDPSSRPPAGAPRSRSATSSPASLGPAREEPDFVTTWLKDYRWAVPRGERQALIDTTDLEQTLDRLSEKPLSLRVLRYRLMIYLAAAQGCSSSRSRPSSVCGGRHS